MKQKATTVGFDEETVRRIKAQAEVIGVPWTTMVRLLVREALTVRERK